MVKVSVIMPVYNAEKFLKDSVDSILNQTLTDLEFICADDGSSDNSLNILNEYAKKDSHVKVFSLDHQGGGNARNYALTKVTGEYLYIMDADDILDLNAFQEFYSISKSNNLDFLIFKAINYNVDEDNYYETNYYSMPVLSNAMKGKVFGFKDLGELLFHISVTPWSKFYNTQFIKKSGAKFRENSKFHDNQFFWDIIFQAERIYFLDEFYYTRTRHSESLTASGDEHHIDIIGVVNDIIALFIKHGQLDKYKNRLFNMKILWIIQRYNQIQEKFMGLFYKEMKKDFELNENASFADNLWSKNKYIYDSILISKDYKDFNLLYEYYKILINNKLTADEKILDTEIWFNSINETYQAHFFERIKSDLKNYKNNEISSENKLFYNTIINSDNFDEYMANHKYQMKIKLDSIIAQEEKLSQYIKENESENHELLTKLEELNLFTNKIYKEMALELSHISKNSDSNYPYLKKFKSNMKKQDFPISDLNNDFNKFKSLNILKDALISDLNNEIKNCHNTIENKNTLISDLNNEIKNCHNTIEDKNTSISDLNKQVKNLQNKINEENKSINNLEHENVKEDLSKLQAELKEYQITASKNEFMLLKLTSENKYLIKKNAELNKVNLELTKKNKKDSIFKR